MKKLYFILLFTILSNTIFAQTPEMMSYQAIIRDASGELVQNANVGIQISVLQNSEAGTAVYTETHTAMTNDNGLVSLNIGAGSTSDVFSSIDWSTGTYYVKSETDPTGGTNYSISGTSQLLSVPYALYAKTTETLASDSNGVLDIQIPSDNLVHNSTFIMHDEDANSLYVFNGVTGNWSSQSVSDLFSSFYIIRSIGYFIADDSDVNIIHGYSRTTESWSSQSVSATFVGSPIIPSAGYFMMHDSEANTLYVYSGPTGTWSSQSVSNLFSSSSIFDSNGSFIMHDSGANILYAYSGITETWSSQSVSDLFNDSSIVDSNGYFIMHDSDANTLYAYSGSTGTWSSQSTSGLFSGSPIIGSGH